MAPRSVRLLLLFSFGGVALFCNSVMGVMALSAKPKPGSSLPSMSLPIATGPIPEVSWVAGRGFSAEFASIRANEFLACPCVQSFITGIFASAIPTQPQAFQLIDGRFSSPGGTTIPMRIVGRPPFQQGPSVSSVFRGNRRLRIARPGTEFVWP